MYSLRNALHTHTLKDLFKTCHYSASSTSSASPLMSPKDLINCYFLLIGAITITTHTLIICLVETACYIVLPLCCQLCGKATFSLNVCICNRSPHRHYFHNFTLFTYFHRQIPRFLNLLIFTDLLAVIKFMLCRQMWSKPTGLHFKF